MKEYLELQFKLIGRTFKDAGLTPVVAIALLLLAFFGFSIFLFYKTGFAQYIYVMTALSVIGSLSEVKRGEFLALTFGDKQMRKIRLLENTVLLLPFLIFLLYQKCFLAALFLSILSVIFALLKFRKKLFFTLPTPFYKRPYEFTVGFRNTFYLIFVAYGIATASIIVHNFSLGVFALLFVFAITLSYYMKPEDEYFVWSHNTTVKQFLFEKMKTATLFSAILILPIFTVLIIFFYRETDTILLFYIAGWAFLPCVIICKYAAFPEEVSVTQGILLALCVSFPPLLIFVTTYFFKEAESRLNRLLL